MGLMGSIIFGDDMNVLEFNYLGYFLLVSQSILASIYANIFDSGKRCSTSQSLCSFIWNCAFCTLIY